MANRYAVATGNWSNTATWNGGTLPQAGDVVRPNNYQVTIDQDITGVTLTNNASSPAVANGNFIITSAITRTLTCDLQGIATNGFGGFNYLLRLQSTGIVNIVGNVTNSGSGNGNAVATVSIEANCTLNHTGNGTGGSNTVGYGVACPAFRAISVCTMNMVGIYTGGSGFDGTTVYNPAIEIFTGSYLVTLNVTGSVLGGSAFFTPAISIRNGISIVSVIGIIQSSSVSPAILYQPSTSFTNPTTLSVSGTITNTNGFNAIVAPRISLRSLLSQSWLYQTENALVSKTLYSADLLTGYPLEANVEDGTVYGPSSEFEGTLVPVNIDTTQLAADLLNEIAASPLPLAERLRNVATTSIVNSAVGSINVIP